MVKRGLAAIVRQRWVCCSSCLQPFLPSASVQTCLMALVPEVGLLQLQIEEEGGSKVWHLRHKLLNLQESYQEEVKIGYHPSGRAFLVVNGESTWVKDIFSQDLQLQDSGLWAGGEQVLLEGRDSIFFFKVGLAGSCKIHEVDWATPAFQHFWKVHDVQQLMARPGKWASQANWIHDSWAANLKYVKDMLGWPEHLLMLKGKPRSMQDTEGQAWRVLPYPCWSTPAVLAILLRINGIGRTPLVVKNLLEQVFLHFKTFFPTQWGFILSLDQDMFALPGEDAQGDYCLRVQASGDAMDLSGLQGLEEPEVASTFLKYLLKQKLDLKKISIIQLLQMLYNTSAFKFLFKQLLCQLCHFLVQELQKEHMSVGSSSGIFMGALARPKRSLDLHLGSELLETYGMHGSKHAMLMASAAVRTGSGWFRAHVQKMMGAILQASRLHLQSVSCLCLSVDETTLGGHQTMAICAGGLVDGTFRVCWLPPQELQGNTCAC